MSLVVGAKFSGWFEAPLGLGRTEFVLTVEGVEEEEGKKKWVGRGRDLTTLTTLGSRRQEEKEFTVEGTEEGDNITFTKEFCDGSHSGIIYRGKLDNVEGDVTVRGSYSFRFSKLWISMQITENFQMTLDQ